MQLITLSSILALLYLRAVLDESLRMSQPVPSHSPRIIQPGGQIVAGHWIAGGLSCADLSQWCSICRLCNSENLRWYLNLPDKYRCTALRCPQLYLQF